MSRNMRLAYIAHSIRSDWNNGNAHFLRGLLRELHELGNDVQVFEPAHGWSVDHLAEEAAGAESLTQFSQTYAELRVTAYPPEKTNDSSFWRGALDGFDVVILHEWNPPVLAEALLAVREDAGFRILFHDTHHRATSSPEQIKRLSVDRCDGVIAFGEALRAIYRERFGIDRVWTLHEAADTSVFRPLKRTKTTDVVWVGNWGDNERSQEIREFLLGPATALRDRTFVIHGVRYPDEALQALRDAGVAYEGYLANLDAPEAYAESKVTVHVPRQQYVQAMKGIPTIRVFEALACGIPLVSAPWADTEGLFRKGDFLWARHGREMTEAIRHLLEEESAAQEQAQRGLETVLARHTCRHRAQELMEICTEVLQ